MDLHELKAKLLGNPVSLSIWVVLTVLGIATLIRNVLSWNGWFNSMITRGVVVDPKANQMLVSGWLFWVFASLCAISLVLAAFLIRSEINLSAALKVKSERKTTAFKTLQGMMWAAVRIRDQQHPSASQVKKTIRNVRMEYRIHANFDTDCEQRWDIYASQEPVHFWSTSVRATSEAQGAEYLDDINFKVRDDSGNGVVYLPTENDPRAKKVVIYFLPRIDPGGPDRKIVLNWFWPGLFNQLKNKGSEEFNWTTESLGAIEKAEFVFYLDKGSKHSLHVENIGPQCGQQKLESLTDGAQWSGYSYIVENIPAGKFPVSLLLRLKSL